MRIIEAPATRRLAELMARLLLLGIVAFWWGLVILPNFLSLTAPTLLPAHEISDQLQPGLEGTIANTVSAAVLLAVALLALGNVIVSWRRASGWIVLAGWATLSLAAAYLAWEESSDFHSAAMRTTGLGDIGRTILGEEMIQRTGAFVWLALVSPLIAAFVIVMGVFVRVGLRNPAVRTLFVLGLIAWLLAAAHEASNPLLFRSRSGRLKGLLEESLEFGGALLFMLGAALALFESRSPVQTLQNRWRRLTAGSIVLVVGIGGLAAAFVFQVPVVDGRSNSGDTLFWVSLQDQQSVAQEFRMPATPLAGVSLRLANRDPSEETGAAIVRIMESMDGRPIREAWIEVPPRNIPQWIGIGFPPLFVADGQTLFVQVVADIRPGASLRIGAVKPDRYPNGRLWINGAPTWSDQDLEFALTSHPAPSVTKLWAIWHMLTSDWRWPALIAMAAVGLTLVILTPAILVATALSRSRPRPSTPENAT